jgi:hypothetical protein
MRQVHAAGDVPQAVKATWTPEPPWPPVQRVFDHGARARLRMPRVHLVQGCSCNGVQAEQQESCSRAGGEDADRRRPTRRRSRPDRSGTCACPNRSDNLPPRSSRPPERERIRRDDPLTVAAAGDRPPDAPLGLARVQGDVADLVGLARDPRRPGGVSGSPGAAVVSAVGNGPPSL